MNVLLVGLGSIGKKHVDAIIELEPSANIFALRSGNNAEVYKSVVNLFPNDEFPKEIDFAVISNVTSLHGKTINELLQYRYPLFIEKPVLSSLEGGNIISRKIAQNEILTYVACNLRFHPSLQFIKKYLDLNRPRINEVNIYCGSYLPNWRPDRNFKTVYSADKDLGGGVHLDLIHEIDYCTWLFGFPSFYASDKRSVSSLGINSIDYANFRFRYADFSASITLNYYRRDAKRTIEILTEDDTLVVDLISNTVSSNSTGSVLFESKMKIADTYKEQMLYFLTKIKNGEQPMNSFDNAFKVLQIAMHE